MKRIQTILLTTVIAGTALISTTYTSCKKDKCKNITCSNGGTCDEGKCSCPSGYSGDKCETETRTTYYKTYKGSGTDDAGDPYPDCKLVFSKGDNSVTSMHLDVKDQNELTMVSLELNLVSATAFDIVSKTVGTTVYSGSGTISSSSASLKLKVVTVSGTLEINFAQMAAQ